MTADLNRTPRRHTGRPPHALNRLLMELLRSPLHGLLDPGLCELTFDGRRTGRLVTLPVIHADDGDQVIVLIGDADAKVWWRNFRTAWPIKVRRGGTQRTGTARILAGDDPAYRHAWQVYRDRHHMPREDSDRLLLIDLDPVQGR